MPPLTIQLDPATRARVADDAARIKCPACGGSCTREERAGTGAGRRVQVQCAYCEFSELVEFPYNPFSGPRAIDPDAADRYRPGTDPISTLPRAACLVKCGKLAIDGGFCEPCNRAWRIAGRPEPRDQWAIHHADQLAADRAKTVLKRSYRTRANPKEADMSINQTVQDSLPSNEKKRWAYVKKVVPGLDIEQWIADGKPKPTHYRKAAKAVKAAPKAPSKPVRPSVEAPLEAPWTAPVKTSKASLPAVKSGTREPLPNHVPGELCNASDPLADLASSIIATAAKRGGRCRVMIFDLTLDGESDS